uniref:Twinkle protein, mitochondrial n=2 Tax=Lygus hesperus TaxID=30085 RepID=A0A0A9YFF0_LYGHE
MFLYRTVCRRVTVPVLKKTTRNSRCSKIVLTRKLFNSSRCGCSADSRTSIRDQEVPVNTSDFVSVSQVKQKLLKNNHVFEDGHCCLSVDCVFCKSQSKLFINKITGFFICYGCSRAGSWQQLEHVLTNHSAASESQVEKEEGTEDGSAAWKKISKHLRPVGDLSEGERISVTQKLDFKTLPWSLLERKGVMLDDKNDEFYWPLAVPGNETVVPGYKTICSDLSEQCYPHSSAAGVVILTSEEGRAKTAVLVPTLRDSLALSLQDLKGIDVICLPHVLFASNGTTHSGRV